MALITCPECAQRTVGLTKKLMAGLLTAILSCVMAGCTSNGEGGKATPQLGDGLEVPTAGQESGSAASSFASASVGDIIIFGSFGQSAKSDVAEKPLEWRVLAIEGNRILLVSVYALDCRPFNASDKQGNSWGESDLAAWLVGDFMESAFTEDERGSIIEITCLSVDEARRYFSDDAARACKPTAYAATHGAITYKGGCYWWLRSPGTNGDEYAAFVTGDGRIMAGGQPVSNTNRAVRPAMWLNL